MCKASKYCKDDAPKDSAGVGTGIVKRDGSSGVWRSVGPGARQVVPKGWAGRVSSRGSCCLGGIFPAKLLLHHQMNHVSLAPEPERALAFITYRCSSKGHRYLDTSYARAARSRYRGMAWYSFQKYPRVCSAACTVRFEVGEVSPARQNILRAVHAVE